MARSAKKMKGNLSNIPNYDLLAKYFAGECSVTEKQEIEKWVKESPKNKKNFDKIYFLWIQTSKKELEKEINVDDAWQKAQNRIKKDAQIKKDARIKKSAEPFSIAGKAPRKDKVILKRVLQIAAILVVGVFLTYTYSIFQNGEKSQFANNENIKFLLADSSHINLDKNSELTYPEQFAENERRVKLKGEAFFDIQRNTKQPFVIEAGHGEIMVLGTSFNVEAYDTAQNVKVTVFTGKVQLSDNQNRAQKIVLIKGESGLINKKTGKIKKIGNPNFNQFFEKTKTLIFKETEMYVVAQTLSEVYNIHVEIDSDIIRSCKLSTTFKDASLQEILKVISNTFSISVEKKAESYVLTGDGC